MHIFLNILFNVLDCYKESENVSIEIEPIQRVGEEYWQTEIKTPCSDKEDQRTYSSGVLGLSAARIITESLYGTLDVKDYRNSESIRMKLFTILLPAVKI